MSVTRRTILSLAGGALVAPALLREGYAQAPQFTFRMHHFLPPASNAHQHFLTPWARKVEAESGGRIKIDIFPAMQLGGAPPQLFDQARDGVADIIWTLPGNTPGRFPSIEVFELPFVAAKRGITNSRAIAEVAPTYFFREFAEVQPLCLWAHDHGLIHANRPVRTMADMQGLKLRFATRQTGEALRALGATPVGMPVPQVPEALAQRVIDGTVIPWEVVPSLRVHELVRNHTEFPGSPTFYTATFILAMNKPKYEALPADLKQVIDANSGMAAAQMAGAMWDERSGMVGQMVRGRSQNTVIMMAEDEAARWRTTTQPVIDAWIRSIRERNIDGQKLLDDARAALSRHAMA